jgi:hypothetical protein
VALEDAEVPSAPDMIALANMSVEERKKYVGDVKEKHMDLLGGHLKMYEDQRQRYGGAEGTRVEILIRFLGYPISHGLIASSNKELLISHKLETIYHFTCFRSWKP